MLGKSRRGIVVAYSTYQRYLALDALRSLPIRQFAIMRPYFIKADLHLVRVLRMYLMLAGLTVNLRWPLRSISMISER